VQEEIAVRHAGEAREAGHRPQAHTAGRRRAGEVEKHHTEGMQRAGRRRKARIRGHGRRWRKPRGEAREEVASADVHLCGRRPCWSASPFPW
jgi:hypothetical protein